MRQLTLEQAESRLFVIMTARKNLDYRLKANDRPTDIAREQRLLALYTEEWLPQIRELVPDTEQRLEKSQANH
jgi:hypothetical protein